MSHARGRQRKVTEAMRAEVLAAVVARRAIPSNRQIAEKWDCCKGLIDVLSAQIAMDLDMDEDPRGTSGLNATSLNDVRG